MAGAPDRREWATMAQSLSASLLDSKDVNYGYDAQKGEFTDMIKAGITDPTKVVRHALQDAASIAGPLITTEAMVAEKPEPKLPMPAMPPGFCGMGRMDFCACLSPSRQHTPARGKPRGGFFEPSHPHAARVERGMGE